MNLQIEPLPGSACQELLVLGGEGGPHRCCVKVTTSVRVNFSLEQNELSWITPQVLLGYIDAATSVLSNK